MPKNEKYGNMPKAQRTGGTSGSKSVIGHQGSSTSAPYKSGPDTGPSSLSAPYHWQPRPTGSKPFPGKK